MTDTHSGDRPFQKRSEGAAEVGASAPHGRCVSIMVLMVALRLQKGLNAVRWPHGNMGVEAKRQMFVFIANYQPYF